MRCELGIEDKNFIVKCNKKMTEGFMGKLAEGIKKIKEGVCYKTSIRYEREGHSVLGEGGKSLLKVNSDTGVAEFCDIQEADFFVEARIHMRAMIRRVEELEKRLEKVTRSKDREISELKYAFEWIKEAEEKRQEEYKQLHGVLEVFEIPKWDKRGSHNLTVRFQILIDKVSECVGIQEEDKEMRQRELLTIFNELLEVFPLKYKELNKNFPAGCKKDKLRELEKKNTKLGLSYTDTDREGFSVLSLLATITDVFCDKRLAFKLDEEKNLTGVCYYFFNEAGDWVEDTALNRIPHFISEVIPEKKDLK